ncbi:DUF6876 family protein [Chryseobacterium taichungense]|uniref:DUF6876 family protein n=1 Tax=Chryseobacterium taichungense TaxID=295069 RepID=UPI0028AAC781|nr:DUF6876 family protein [Chryseobacterium taichungense]
MSIIKRNKKRNSANTLYDAYKAAEDLYDYKEGYKLSKGIFDVSNEEDCKWLLEIILNEQSSLYCEFQYWHLKRIEGSTFMLYCTDEEGNVLTEINDISINFFFDDLFLLVKKNLLCLPIESKMYA